MNEAYAKMMALDDLSRNLGTMPLEHAVFSGHNISMIFERRDRIDSGVQGALQEVLVELANQEGHS